MERLLKLIDKRNVIWKDYMKYFDCKKNEITIPYPIELVDIENEVLELLKDVDDEKINGLVKENHWIKKKN